MKINITRTTSPRPRIETAKLGFGKYFSDHMFLAKYSKGNWENIRIEPYGPLTLDPGACVLHYSQCLFEGMKAFRDSQGGLRLFRPEFHAKRFAAGAERLCMPSVPTELFLEGLRALVALDKDWVPAEEGASLYLRPTLIGTESFLGVRPADEYLFFIICSPVGAYYAEGFKPLKIWVEQDFIRAAPGGLGAIKAGANYAASLKAFVQAKKQGYAQVLWLDATHKENVEEVGTMNVFFRLKDEIVTPPLGGTILNGATRDCVIELLKKWNLPIRERNISLKEVFEAQKSGALLEVFGSGTAAVISPVGELATTGEKLVINNNQVGELTLRLYKEIMGIQHGRIADPFGWTESL